MATASAKAEIRGDLMRRLFAVAISVGAASTLAKMGWVQKGRWPDLGEWQQLSILTAAMTATVLSWDGYLLAIKERPLEGFWRFTIDIALVFIYMFLLMTSEHHTWWLFIHALIYFLYIVWDFLTVREHLDEYFKPDVPRDSRSVWKVYAGGLRGTLGVSVGPIITLSWGVYFFILYGLNRPDLSKHIFATTVFALAGLILYRVDKAKRYSTPKRLAVIICWLVASFLATQYGPYDEYIAANVTSF